MTAVRLVGQRILLRSLRTQDSQCYVQWQAPGHEWQKLDGPYYRTGEFDAETQEREFQEQLSRSAAVVPTRLAISPVDDGRLIGTVNSYWESRETHWLCAGISIFDPDFWGQGLGYEALGLWTEYLFASYPEIVRLDLRTWSGNHGMVRLAQKLGYLQEACFRKARIVDGRYYDGLGYGVLRDEWVERYPEGFSSSL